LVNTIHVGLKINIKFHNTISTQQNCIEFEKLTKTLKTGVLSHLYIENKNVISQNVYVI
jgi:hypothetical protein